MNPVFFFGKLLNTRILSVYINTKIQVINLIGFPNIKLTASSSNMFSNTASNITDKDSEIVHPASKPMEDQTDARSSYLQSASTHSAASVGGFSLNSFFFVFIFIFLQVFTNKRLYITSVQYINTITSIVYIYTYMFRITCYVILYYRTP